MPHSRVKSLTCAPFPSCWQDWPTAVDVGRADDAVLEADTTEELTDVAGLVATSTFELAVAGVKLFLK